MGWRELGAQALQALTHTACSFWYPVRVPVLNIQMGKLRPERWSDLFQITQVVSGKTGMQNSSAWELLFPCILVVDRPCLQLWGIDATLHVMSSLWPPQYLGGVQ